jgi:hypothetical protein
LASEHDVGVRGIPVHPCATVGRVFMAVFVINNFVDDDRTVAQAWQNFIRTDAFWISTLAWPAMTAATIVVISAANNLRRFRRYPLVITGTVLTLLAIPCSFVGVFQLPLGIWLLALLLRRDVRARFEAVARATIPPSPPEPADARIDRIT